MMKNLVKCALAAAALAAAAGADAATKAAKWLVLDKIAYAAEVDARDFEGIDSLLLTKLAQAGKYKVLDRDAYDTAAREEGFGANVELVPAGYSMRGEIVQMRATGSRKTANSSLNEYVATVSLRANNLRTQEAYEAETLRVKALCETPKDMLVHVVRQVSLAMLMREYPMYVMDADEDGEITLSYGSDFIRVGERYEVRSRKAIVDKDNGDTVYKEKTTGVCEVTSTGKRTSQARMVSGRAKVDSILRFYDEGESAPEAGTVPVPSAEPVPVQQAQPVAEVRAPAASILPRKSVRIAVAPFISKKNAFNVQGLSIGARQWMDDVADHLNAELAGRGGFAVLDRSFGQELDAELGRITSDPNADPNDVVRLCRKITADYVIVAEVVFTDVVSPGNDYATGLPLPPQQTVFAEVRFRCASPVTTQIALADSVAGDSRYFGGTSEQFSSASAGWTAQQIADAVQGRFNPAGLQAELSRRAAAAAAAAAEASAPAAQGPSGAPVNVGF